MADAPLYGEAIRRMIPLMAAIRARYNVTLTGLNTLADRVFRMRQVTPNWNSTLCDLIDDALEASCAAERFPRPTVVVEPGRAISARAGVTLYRSCR